MLELKDRSFEDLTKLAGELKLEVAKNIKKTDLEELLERALIERKIRLETEAQAKLNLEAQKKLGLTGKEAYTPSPETRRIEKSKRKFYKFSNLEEQGVNITVRKGEKYRFSLFDGKIHVLPEFLVKDLRQRSVVPVYQMKADPVTGQMRSVQTGTRPRFNFEELDDAGDAEFGVVLDTKVLDRLLQPDEMLV